MDAVFINLYKSLDGYVETNRAEKVKGTLYGRTFEPINPKNCSALYLLILRIFGFVMSSKDVARELDSTLESAAKSLKSDLLNGGVKRLTAEESKKLTHVAMSLLARVKNSDKDLEDRVRTNIARLTERPAVLAKGQSKTAKKADLGRALATHHMIAFMLKNQSSTSREAKVVELQ